MPLKISLKPDEKLFIGGAVIQNGSSHCDLSILNDVPVLRERDILTEATADSHCRRIYLCIQMMYMDPSKLGLYQKDYAILMAELLQAVPTTASYVAAINSDLAIGRYYQALKSARQLVDYEQELIKNVQKPD